MSGMFNNKNGDSTTMIGALPSKVFFFSQTELNRASSKRPKKQINAQTLANLNKKTTNKLLNGNEFLMGDNTGQPIGERLAELIAAANAKGTQSTSSMRSLSNHQLVDGAETKTKKKVKGTLSYQQKAQNTLVFTDTRLQAVKYLTEDMLRELDENIELFYENNSRPELPAKVIIDWHADWSDLTEKCSLTGQYPQWQTKNGREGPGKLARGGGGTDGKTSKLHSRLDENPSQLAGHIDSALDNYAHKDTRTISSLSKKSQNTTITNVKIVRQSSKLSSITETTGGGARTSRNNRRLSTVKSNMSPLLGAPVKTRTDGISSRNNQNGVNVQRDCVTLSYNLSSEDSMCWTVLKFDLNEEKTIENEKKIAFLLAESKRKINELELFVEKYSLKKPSKIRFYGDHRREQMEKLKNPEKLERKIKPKMSAFAMSIRRFEVPKLLDLNYMLDIQTNPNLVGYPGFQQQQLQQQQQLAAAIAAAAAAKSNSSSSTSNFYSPSSSTLLNTDSKYFSGSFGTGSSASFVSLLPKPPPILSSQTNDGTTCVYYPNGQLAIVVSNVYGYYVDANPSSTSINAQLLPTSNMDASFSSKAAAGANVFSSNSSFNLGSTSSVPTLCSQNVTDSYTTIIYGQQVNGRAKKYSKNSIQLNNLNLKNTSSMSSLTDDNSSTKGPIKPGSAGPASQTANGNIVCILSSLGSCVVYRNNGNPKFICTEFGGCLCNKSGAAYYQWKWDELRLKDYEKFKHELQVDINENIRLEYKNPSDIKVKFNCDRETFEFNLGCQRDNMGKLHELLNKTVSDVDLQSKAGQLKLATNAKAAQILTYKQQHIQYQQQQASHLNRKMSTNLPTHSKDFVGESASKLDRLFFDSTVSHKDVPVIKDLLVVQKKIRNLLEDWLVHCRSSLSILEPDMYLLPELAMNKHKYNRLNRNHADFDKIVLYRRKSKSAENLSAHTSTQPHPHRNTTFTDAKKILLKSNNHASKDDLRHGRFLIAEQKRSKSALIVRKTGKTTKSDETSKSMNISEKINIFRTNLLKNDGVHKELMSKSSSLMLKKQPPNLKTNMSKSSVWSSVNDFNALKANASARLLAASNKSLGPSAGDQSLLVSARSVNAASMYDDLNLMCPITVHQRMANENYEFECKCKKMNVPFISDLEFDYFIRLMPVEQLICIVVIDSYNSAYNIQEIVEELYLKVNKNRLQPCKESLKDEVRYFFYDARTAICDSDHTIPLLVSRHNIAPGMVLIYKNSKLLFCDHIFNGYGYSEQDFLKQLQKCKEDSLAGKYLPYNFRFDHPIGKHGRRTPWGGQIGGVEACLIDNNANKNLTHHLRHLAIQQHANAITDAEGANNDSPSLVRPSSTTSLVPSLFLKPNQSVNKNDPNSVHLPKINKTLQV